MKNKNGIGLILIVVIVMAIISTISKNSEINHRNFFYNIWCNSNY